MAPDETGGTEDRTVDRAHGDQAEPVHGGRQGDGRAPVATLTLAEPAGTLWRPCSWPQVLHIDLPRGKTTRAYETGAPSPDVRVYQIVQTRPIAATRPPATLTTN